MKRSNRLVLLIGIFLAIVAFALILITLQKPQTSAPPVVTTTTIVVATRDMALGTKITPDAIREDTIDKTKAPANGFALKSLVIGQTVRKDVIAEQAITTEILTGGSGTVSDIVVPPGFVGISIHVDQTSGVGTLIKPGDRVDIVSQISKEFPVAQFVPATGPRASPVAEDLKPKYDPTSVKAVVQGLQVLGTLLPAPTTTAAENAPAGASPRPSAGTSLNGQEELVIVAATLQQAEAIKFAQLDGDISLVLRSVADCQTPEGLASQCPIVPTTGITLRILVDDWGVVPPQIVEVVQPDPIGNTGPNGGPNR